MKLSFLQTKILRRRVAMFGLIVMCYSLLLGIYSTNEETIHSFRPYYLNSYLYTTQYALGNTQTTTASKATLPPASSVPVLVYHGMVPQPDTVSTSLEQFKNAMFALKKAGYQTVNISDFRLFIEGKKQLPAKSFLLTFDDGRKDSYYPVDPILAQLHYSAVMFVITGTVDAKSPYHLSKKELSSMQRSGRWDLQAHTYMGHGLFNISEKGDKGHFYSNKLWLSKQSRLETDDEFRLRVRQDLLQAKDDIKKQFAVNAYGFAFPFNDYARESVNFPGAQKIFNQEVAAIYPLLFYQVDTEKNSPNNLFGSNSQMIKRINIETDWGPEKIRGLLDQQQSTTVLKL